MDNRSLILDHLLPLVPFDGWSDHALAQAAKRAGIDAAGLKRAFPAGIADCIRYFHEQEDKALATAFPEARIREMRVPQRIEALALYRLERLAPHKEAVRRAVAWHALPWHAAQGMRTLYNTVDMMWRIAGDNSTDFNFYTKRATLAALFSSTLLYWLNDSSESYGQTRLFLKRGLAGIAAFGKRKQALKSKLPFPA